MSNLPQAPYFAAIFKASVTGNPYRPQFAGISRKRKRDSTTVSGSLDNQPSGSTSGNISLSVSIPRDVSKDHAAQYEISGQPTNKKLPGGKFPHGFPSRYENNSFLENTLEQNDESDGPRPSQSDNSRAGFAKAGNKSDKSGLRQQHLMTLNAIMHKCLLECDYSRASRAWGLLLRAEFSGHSFDLRPNGRWGIGAEVVLRRAQFIEPQGETEERADSTMSMRRKIPSHYASTQGIEQAKEYYQRLVLQYPYRKAFPKMTGCQQFYLAMFGLWIYSAQERHAYQIAKVKTDAVEAGEIAGSGLNDLLISDSALQFQQIEEIRQDTLTVAHEITVRLEELLNSPPYSDNATFWDLLGMVKLWVGDLLLSTQSPRNNEYSTHESDLSGLEGGDFADGLRNSERTGREQAIAGAEKAFERAKGCSTGLT